MGGQRCQCIKCEELEDSEKEERVELEFYQRLEGDHSKKTIIESKKEQEEGYKTNGERQR